MEIKKVLSNLGLDKGEVATLLACLELGSSSASQIADRAELKRTTVYGNLQKLAKRGLISVSGQDHRQIYNPEPPQVLQKIWQDQGSGLKLVLPELEKIYQQAGTAPKFRFYSGRAGFKRILDHLLKKRPSTIHSFLSAEGFLASMGQDFMSTWAKERVDLGIKSYGLRIRHDDVLKEEFSGQKKYLRQDRYLPPQVDFEVSVVMYENFVFVLSFTEQYGFLIESKDFYRFVKSLFDLVWEISEPSDIK